MVVLIFRPKPQNINYFAILSHWIKKCHVLFELARPFSCTFSIGTEAKVHRKIRKFSHERSSYINHNVSHRLGIIPCETCSAFWKYYGHFKIPIVLCMNHEPYSPRSFFMVFMGPLRRLTLAFWVTDHYHPCSNLGVGISEGCFIFHFASLPMELVRLI